MKKIKLYMITLAAITAGFTLTSCDDDFMNEIPQTAITVPGYFNSVTDLETYTNTFYGLMPELPEGFIRDADSDNVTGPGHRTGDELWGVINGLRSKSNIGGWDKWEKLRTANVLLDNADRVQGTEADIKHYIGFTRYFRALLYIDMVQRYSDVPWIEHAIGSDDPDVTRPSDPRTFVVNKIMEDLEYACANLKTTIGTRNQINKYCALTLLSRFALYEGTFRKYHKELNLQSNTADEFGRKYTDFLERAVWAADQVMISNQFAIAGRSVNEPSPNIFGSPDYRDLFASIDLKDNREIIRWIAYSSALGIQAPAINRDHYSLSRSLMESYLNSDGTTFSTRAGYATLPYYDGFVNRDPRLAENFAHPGSSLRKPSHVPYPMLPTKGGYCQEKFEANQSDANYWKYEGVPLYRYAEVLLNFAEAKAELGTLTAADLDKSINLLRKRVGMPNFDASREVDQILRRQYPNIDGQTVSDQVRAVRRERRVELASEGFRLQDLYRWGVGERFLDPEAQQGIWIPAFGAYDSDGDGIPDCAIVQKESDIPEDWEKSGIKWYYFTADLQPNEKRRGEQAESFTLSETTHGYIVNKELSVRGFISPKYYYRPVNVTHTVLNPGIKQPFGWDN